MNARFTLKRTFAPAELCLNAIFERGTDRHVCHASSLSLSFFFSFFLFFFLSFSFSLSFFLLFPFFQAVRLFQLIHSNSSFAWFTCSPCFFPIRVLFFLTLLSCSSSSPPSFHLKHLQDEVAHLSKQLHAERSALSALRAEHIEYVLAKQFTPELLYVQMLLLLVVVIDFSFPSFPPFISVLKTQGAALRGGWQSGQG